MPTIVEDDITRFGGCGDVVGWTRCGPAKEVDMPDSRDNQHDVAVREHSLVGVAEP